MKMDHSQWTTVSGLSDNGLGDSELRQKMMMLMDHSPNIGLTNSGLIKQIMMMDHRQWTEIGNDEYEEYELSFISKTVRDIRLSLSQKKMTSYFMLRFLAIKRDVKCY